MEREKSMTRRALQNRDHVIGLQTVCENEGVFTMAQRESGLQRNVLCVNTVMPLPLFVPLRHSVSATDAMTRVVAWLHLRETHEQGVRGRSHH